MKEVAAEKNEGKLRLGWERGQKGIGMKMQKLRNG